VTESWNQRDKVDEYVERVGALVPRQTGEQELLEALPSEVESVLDLGCGDARLARLVASAHTELKRIVAVDTSEPMLALAKSTFGHDARATVLRHDLNDSLLPLGTFDAVISGFAIHHADNDRKRELFREIVHVLHPGGVFANLEVVRCATEALHAEFYRRIGRAGDDPEDVLAPVGSQLEWMREAGLVNVDCQWRWRGFALLVGTRP
jgi:ubiquinone/menaquinone biosynthesis C-methylase UbiE